MDDRELVLFERSMFVHLIGKNSEIDVNLGELEDLMCLDSNRAADNPYNSLISLSSSGVPIYVGTLLLFYPKSLSVERVPRLSCGYAGTIE